MWVFGTSGFGPGAGTWHLHGGKWAKVKGLAATISEAGAVTASDLWAVAEVVPAHKLPYNVLAHYNGSSWQRVRYPAPKGFELDRGIVVAGRGSIWVLGRAGKQGWLLHLHGGRWSRTRAPLDLTLAGAASDGRGGLWAPGGNGKGTSYVYHLSGSGRWSRQTIGSDGTGINAIAANPGSRAFLGSGLEVRRASADAAVWRIG